MTGPLSTFGRAWSDFADHLTNFQVSVLRRMSADLVAHDANDPDLAARRAVEGAKDWRGFQNTGSRNAD